MPHRHRSAIPAALRGLIDDAAVFPPGNAALPDAVAGHYIHRNSWYQDLVGPLLLPVSKLPFLEATHPLRIGVIADTGIAAAVTAIEELPDTAEVAQLEARLTDPADLDTLRDLAGRQQVPVFAEIPVVEGLAGNLTRLGPTGIIPKFRTGGLSRELFPTTGELAAAIVGCAEQGLSFKLTAGLHELTRHTDPATGFTHHGFGNVLVAAAAAESGDSVETVTQRLEITDSAVIGGLIRDMLTHSRPLWSGFGSCSIAEPLHDLTSLSLVYEES